MHYTKPFKILIAGCSFSAGIKDNWYAWSCLTEDYLVEKLGRENVKFSNMAQSSAGQTMISNSVINHILNNDTDLVLVQWSAFSRVFGKNDDEALLNMINHFTGATDKSALNLFGTEYSSGTFFDTLSEDMIRTSLIRILLTQLFLNNKKIDYKMWFGWQQLYPEQLNTNNNIKLLTKEVTKDKNLLLFKHSDSYDYECANYLKCGRSTYKSTLEKLFGKKSEDYFWPGSNYGGMTEYIRENLNKNKYNRQDGMEDDQHPSSEGHKVFFEGVIKPILDEKIKEWKAKQ
jgi:hypothetical protein